MGDLLLPVGERRMSSWAAHQKRVPRSTEPGTDFYCPRGTPVYAPESGRVYGYGESIQPATGRWVGIDLDNGMRFRAMHFTSIELSKAVLQNKGFVRKGQLIAYSGASGYGEEDWSWNPNTGGAHTHVTLWPTHESRYGYNSNGKPYTVDFMNYVQSGGGSGSPDPEPSLPPIPVETVDEMIPIWNVVEKIGSAPDSGQVWFGQDNGTVQLLTGYSRGLISVAFFGAKDGTQDKIPTITQAGGDWDKVKALWASMKRR